LVVFEHYYQLLIFYREIVENSEEFLTLSLEQIVELLSNDKLNVQSEEKVYNLKTLAITRCYVILL